MADEPGHQELCDREQAYVLKAIREDLDLTQHMADGDATRSKIVLAADRSVREGRRDRYTFRAGNLTWAP